MNDTIDDNQFRHVRLQSENGLMHIILPRNTCSTLVPGEYIWSHVLQGYIEQGFACMSDRLANNMLNQLLHRDSSIDSIKLRTMSDLVEREGTGFLDSIVTWGEKTLEEHGWDPETGLPGKEAILAPGISAMDSNAYGSNLSTDEERKQEVQTEEMIAALNMNRSEEFKIPDDPRLRDGVLSSKNVVSVSLDGVCTKRQKDTRPAKTSTGTSDEPFYTQDALDGPENLKRVPDPKKRPKVETAVAHIEADGRHYTLTAMNMFLLCKLVLAFLLSHNLLRGRDLLFLTDGGKDIKGAVETVFAFCPYTVILDWFHLRKHCQELLSMSIIGGKANFEIQYEIKRNLFRRLFYGNVDSAIKYLDSLPKNHVKNTKQLQALKDYLDRKRNYITCYVLRWKSKLRISSNAVEKANDMLVSKRQKGNGMSWSRNGSWALGGITMKYLNHESKNWNENHFPAFNMHSKYGTLFCANDDVAGSEKVA